MSPEHMHLRSLGKASSLAELVDLMCRRPGMFTLTGTFEEVAAWCQGFAAGLAQGTAGDREWAAFVDWLPRRLGYPGNVVWCAEFRRRYPDDSTALDQLRVLFAEYWQSR